MGKPYESEMLKLADTFAWASAADIAPLRQAVLTAGLSPLRAIGSGGSLTSAHALTSLHQRWTGQIAAVATPLEVLAEPLESRVTNWLLSAGGGNVDIIAAFRTLVAREPRQLVVLCGRSESALANLAREHPFVDLVVYEPPTGKDGFLATNSLLAFSALLTRAYLSAFEEGGSVWSETAAAIENSVRPESKVARAWERGTEPIWVRSTTLVLHGPTTRLGAIDLESKFTEAAIGNLQVADYRNFAHGRHVWLAKRAATTGVLAFLTDDDRSLAERTLALIPKAIPQTRLDLNCPPDCAPLASLVAALRVAGWAGASRGIDPGRPGVPQFGRKLYNLPLPRPPSSKEKKTDRISGRDAAAITRKAGASVAKLAARGELQTWRAKLSSFKARLLETSFAGVVLDYDGTIVDTRRRFLKPTSEVADQLVRLIESGVHVAVATGRGASVRRDLQESLPYSLWHSVLVGYYNGAEVARLDEDDAPDGTAAAGDALAATAIALRAHPELGVVATQTDRRFQLTIQAKRAVSEGELWDLVHEAILKMGCQGVTAMRSSHSIDIVPSGVSKVNVLARIRATTGSAPLLTIGDRGRWPGNDYELLREPFALSVDDVSSDAETCWNLAVSGQRGVAATVDYLSGLAMKESQARFRRGALR
jgi:HAD superfamily hydrolase (TIGR01484 family)